MWCKSCRQDVPGIASSLDRQYCCARCGSVLELPASVGNSSVGSAEGTANDVAGIPASTADNPPPPFDFWETNEQLRHVERVLQAVQRSWDTDAPTAEPSVEARLPGRLLRIDPAEAKQPPVALPPSPAPAVPRERRGESRQHRQRTIRVDSASSRESAAKPRGYPVLASVLAWFAWAGGVTAFTCGGVLCGWSWYEGRDDLWNLGLPILLVGQLGLIAGLVLRLDMLRHRNRQTESQIDAVDERLKSLSKRMRKQ